MRIFGLNGSYLFAIQKLNCNNVKNRQCFFMLQVKEELRNMTQKLIDDTVQDFTIFMASDTGKHSILNPKGHDPILEIVWNPFTYKDEIESRIFFFIKQFLQSDILSKKFYEIKTNTVNFYKYICSELCIMKNKRVKEYEEVTFQCDYDEDPLLVKLSILNTLNGITIVGMIALGILTSPIIVPVAIYKNTDAQKTKTIDAIYEENKLTAPDKVRSKLECMYGDVLQALIRKVTTDLLSRKLNFERKMAQQIFDTRQEILADRTSLSRLQKQVEEMEKEADELS